MLTADCGNCFGLCCVVPAFSASSEFAIDKPAGRACPNLQPDSRCGIHTELRSKGFAGCAVYDCFGAGQQISQVTFGGQDWRSAPHTAVQMFAVFPIMLALHELLYYLQCALDLVPEGALHDALAAVSADVERQTRTAPEALLAIDVAISRDDVNPLLLRASEFVRAGLPAHTVDHRGTDLIGADLRGQDLRGASLRGAQLVGADLRGTDLRRADVTGADLRAADLRGADLRDALFLAQSQLDAAKGDADTMLSDGFGRPSHW